MRYLTAGERRGGCEWPGAEQSPSAIWRPEWYTIEGWIDRVVKVITHEAWIEGLSLRVKAVEEEEKRQLEGEKVGEGRKVTPWSEERNCCLRDIVLFLFSLMFLIIATSLLSVAVHSRVWSSSTQKSYYSHLGLHFSISITTSILCSMSLLRPHSPRLTHSAPQHSNTPMRILNLHSEPSANLTSWSRETRADGPDPGERGVARSRQGERKRERESGRWER